MREVNIQSFAGYAEALDWLDAQAWDLMDRHTDIKMELSQIDGIWRASIITDTRQGELFDY